MLPRLHPLSVVTGKYEKKEQKLSRLHCGVRNIPSWTRIMMGFSRWNVGGRTAGKRYSMFKGPEDEKHLNCARTEKTNEADTGKAQSS